MAALTPEEISQILEEFFRTVGTRQYIGARYVPIFGRRGEESIQWDDSAPYEPLTIVLYQGNSYTSRQYVPAGVAITNEAFWALTGNYNAQIEAYRAEVLGVLDTVQDILDDIDSVSELLPASEFSTESTVKANLNRIDADIAQTNSDIDTLSTHVDDEIAALSTRIARGGTGILVIGDSYGEGYTPDGNVNSWITVFRNSVTPLGYSVHSGYLGGSAFWRDSSASRFSTIAQEVISGLTSEQRQNIGTVIIGGGYNDRNNTRNQIRDGMVEMRNVITANLPNVRSVLIFPFGMAVEGLTTGTHAGFRYEAIQNMLVNYIDANNNAVLGTIVGNSNMVLRKNSFFSSDYVHPNENGNYILGHFVTDVFLGNDNSIQSVKYANAYQPNITFDSNVTSTNLFYAYTDGDQFVLRRADASGTFNFSTSIASIVMNGSNTITIGTFADAAIQYLADIKIPVTMVIHSTSHTPRSFTTVDGWLRLHNGVITLSGVATKDDGSNYETFGAIDRIQYYLTSNVVIDGTYLV